MAVPARITVEATPNPNALKFTVDRVLWPGRARTVATPEQAFGFPLAARLLAVPGVRSLLFLRDFVTVTRVPEADWEPIIAAVKQAIEAHYAGEGCG
jgi:hypothetical protein